MEARRRIIANSLTHDGYISRGLVFQLDGIRKGTNSSVWSDIIGDIHFALTDCTFAGKGVVFNGSTSIGEYNGVLDYDPATATVEFCVNMQGCSDGSYGLLLCPAAPDGTRNMLGAGLSGSATKTVVTGFGTTNTRWYARAEKVTASANDTRAYGNGNALDVWTNVSTFSTNIGNLTTLGMRKRNTTLSNKFYGTIYAIRIYNRILAAEEMIHNQKIDNTRFALGLNV